VKHGYHLKKYINHKYKVVIKCMSEGYLWRICVYVIFGSITLMVKSLREKYSFIRPPTIEATNTRWITDTVQPCDTNQARLDLDFDVKFSTVQLYAIEHNSKSNCWIELKLYQKIPEVFVYVGVNFQVNRSLEWTCDIGQNKLYEFCY